MGVRRFPYSWLPLALAAALWLPSAVAGEARVELSLHAQPLSARVEGRWITAFELILSNASVEPLEIVGAEVADESGAPVVQDIRGNWLDAALDAGTTGGGPDRSLPRGGRRILYFWVPSSSAPDRLHVRVTVRSSTGTSSHTKVVSIPSSPPLAIGPPLKGNTWVAVYDPDLDRGHRRVFYGPERSFLPGRFAIDFFAVDSRGRMHSASPERNVSWHGYGADVIAVADGEVVAAVDGRPDRTGMETAASADGAGNYIVLKIGGSAYAFYEHLKPGSLTVEAGQAVRRGQRLASLGNSGNTSGPHLHFHVADASDNLQAEGLPFAFDHFDVLGRYADIRSAFLGVPWESTGPTTVDDAMPEANVVIAFPK